MRQAPTINQGKSHVGDFLSLTFSFLSNYLAMLHWDISCVFITLYYIFIFRPLHFLELGTAVVSLWDDLYTKSIVQVSPSFLGKM